ncbi:30S ribosomal protein S8e [Candidatus Micrarchaeota archaeon]|nr:30S ribosomal protein S8e [Candidatus Micrarchaeota archaeon]
MDQYHRPKSKKVNSGTGGRRRKYRDKKLAHVGGTFTATRVADEDERVKDRSRGGKTDLKLKKAATASVVTEEGAKKAKIQKVVESHNPDYVRRNIITKGAVLETDIGKVRVTNRVGQDGLVNGVLVK